MSSDCKTCKYKFLCQNYGKECERYEKEEYTVPVILDNGIKEIRRI